MKDVAPLVEALSNFKKQVDANGGDYLPGNYAQMSEALKTWQEKYEKA